VFVDNDDDDDDNDDNDDNDDDDDNRWSMVDGRWSMVDGRRQGGEASFSRCRRRCPQAGGQREIGDHVAASSTMVSCVYFVKGS